MKYPVFEPSSTTLFIILVAATISMMPDVLESAVLNLTSAWTLLVAELGIIEKIISYYEAVTLFEI
jgi:hypothetical protein